MSPVRYGLYFGSGSYVSGVQQDEFATLAEANAACRLLAERALARHGGRLRRLSRSPLRVIVYDGRNEPIRIWVERVPAGQGMIRYRVPRRSRA